MFDGLLCRGDLSTRGTLDPQISSASSQELPPEISSDAFFKVFAVKDKQVARKIQITTTRLSAFDEFRRMPHKLAMTVISFVDALKAFKT